MIKAQKRTVVNREYILQRIEPYDIFKMYYPYKLELNTAIKSPFTEDDTPSFIIGNKYEQITFKAFNSGHHGDCFHFVEQLFGLDYNEALLKIATDFGMLEGNTEYKSIIQQYEKPEIVKKPAFLQAIPKKFDQRDVEFWAMFHLQPKDLNFCPDTKCYSTKEWALNRQRQPLGNNELCYFYNLVNERGSWLKIYRPEQTDKKKKWRSSIPFQEMHGLANLKGAKKGFIQKSIKDGAFTFKYLNPHVSITQAEDITAISPENIKYINESCEEVWVIFDNDSKGVEACTQLTNETGWKYINPPRHLLDLGITDFTDWAKHAKNPQPVIDFFKQKGAI